MPTIITATQLRNLIGVSSALYDDTYLNQIINTAESVVLPLLTTYKSFIQKTSLTDNVATFTTVGQHEFSEGQSVVIASCGSPYNGTRTVLADNLTSTTFSASITNADIIQANVIPSGTATLSSASTYVGNAAVESAIYAVSVEVFQSRLSSGGSIEGVDFSITPYKLGRSLFNKVSGLLGQYMDVEGIAQ